MTEEEEIAGIKKFITRILVGVAALVVVGMVGCPPYAVYSKRLEGEAKYAEAESSRRITVLEAQAKVDAASKLADAEVARAQGVAKANQIIGSSLKDNESYLRWLWIEGLKDSSHTTVIYIPTEAGLPILEAGKRPVAP